MLQTTLTTFDRKIVSSAGRSRFTNGLYIANTSTSRRRVRLHHVQRAGPADASNAILHDVAIAPSSTLVLELALVLEIGDELIGRADGSGVTVTVYGISDR